MVFLASSHANEKTLKNLFLINLNVIAESNVFFREELYTCDQLHI